MGECFVAGREINAPHRGEQGRRLKRLGISASDGQTIQFARRNRLRGRDTGRRELQSVRTSEIALDLVPKGCGDHHLHKGRMQVAGLQLIKVEVS